MNKEIYKKLSKYKITRKNKIMFIEIPISNISRFLTDFIDYFNKTVDMIYIDNLVFRYDNIEHLLLFYGEDVDEYMDLVKEK
jgi:hypothetical protein